MKKSRLLTPEQIARIQRGKREFERTEQRQLSQRYQRKFAGLKQLLEQLRATSCR